MLGTVLIKKGLVENIKKVSERATVTKTQKICTDAAICTDAQEGVQCMNRMSDLSD